MSGKEENMVTSLEARENANAIESDVECLWYLKYDNGDFGILKISCGEKNLIVMNKEQLKTFIDEIKEIHEVMYN